MTMSSLYTVLVVLVVAVAVVGVTRGAARGAARGLRRREPEPELDTPAEIASRLRRDLSTQALAKRGKSGPIKVSHEEHGLILTVWRVNYAAAQWAIEVSTDRTVRMHPTLGGVEAEVRALVAAHRVGHPDCAAWSPTRSAS